MIIADIRWYVVPTPFKDFLIVLVETDEGMIGVGEGTLDYRSGQVAAGVNAAAQYLVGRSAIGVGRIWSELQDRVFWRGGPADLASLGAIDQALWDIAGKAAALPVHRLLGGPYRSRVPAYLNQWFRGIEQGEDLIELACAAVADGMKALKWYPFRFLPQHEQNWAVRPSDVRRAVDEVAAVREAVGSDVILMVDVWRRLDRAAALHEVLARYYGALSRQDGNAPDTGGVPPPPRAPALEPKVKQKPTRFPFWWVLVGGYYLVALLALAAHMPLLFAWMAALPVLLFFALMIWGVITR